MSPPTENPRRTPPGKPRLSRKEGALSGPTRKIREKVIRAVRKPNRGSGRRRPSAAETDRLPRASDNKTDRLPKLGNDGGRQAPQHPRKPRPPSSGVLLETARQRLTELEALETVEFGPILGLIREAPKMARTEQMFEEDDVRNLTTVRNLIDETEQAFMKLHRAKELTGAICIDELSKSCKDALEAVILVINREQGYRKLVDKKIKQLHIRMPEMKDGREQQA